MSHSRPLTSPPTSVAHTPSIVVAVSLDDGTTIRQVPITSAALQDLFAYLTAEQPRLVQQLDSVDTWAIEVHSGPVEMRVKPRPDYAKWRRRARPD